MYACIGRTRNSDIPHLHRAYARQHGTGSCSPCERASYEATLSATFTLILDLMTLPEVAGTSVQRIATQRESRSRGRSVAQARSTGHRRISNVSLQLRSVQRPRWTQRLRCIIKYTHLSASNILKQHRHHVDVVDYFWGLSSAILLLTRSENRQSINDDVFPARCGRHPCRNVCVFAVFILIQHGRRRVHVVTHVTS